MSCDNELGNEWARCSWKNASYITIIVVAVFVNFERIFKFCKTALFYVYDRGIAENVTRAFQKSF